jgi:hypothetical protein
MHRLAVIQSAEMRSTEVRASFFRAGALVLVSLGSLSTARAAFTTTVTTPYPGVTHTAYNDAAAPLIVHVVTVDASSQEIHLAATTTADRGQTVSGWADCGKGTASGCTPSDVAINGDLFAPSGFVPAGLAIGGAKPWPDASSDNMTEGWIAFGRPGNVNKLQLSPPSVVAMPDAALAVEGAVGGRTSLVQSGMAMSSYDAIDPTAPFRSAPRTAIGLDAAGRTLFLVVVDGDQQSSRGMTAAELADFLVAHGVSDALELDGGGSSTLYVRKEGGVVNSPSDGVERPVANQLGLHYGLSPYRFSVVGQIFDSVFGNMSKFITTATVTVDGQPTTWQNNHTLYHADNIAPHYVCAHASAPGFKSATQCRQITEADVAPPNGTAVQYLSMVLFPGSDPPPDMTRVPDMARQHMTPPSPDLSLPLAPRDLSVSKVTTGGCTVTDGEVPSPASNVALIVLFLGAAMLLWRRA